MGKFKKFNLETTFSNYATEKVIGEGGAGVVFAARDESGEIVAAKVLNSATANSDKRKRFRNEINFCLKCNHRNIVPILDHGVLKDESGSSPFYIMPLYETSLRILINNRIAPSDVLGYFAQIINGVEAAHLLGTVHRDLKPENILVNQKTASVVIADFGIARFTEEMMLTAVETSDASRLANFQYAAPEQRVRGGAVDLRADIYALGLILNEMFTKQLAIGTDYATISAASPPFAYLDAIVAQMLRQNPNERPSNIERLKQELSIKSSEFMEKQQLSELRQTVVPTSDISDQLLSAPSRLTDFDWDHGNLTLMLDKPTNPKWIIAFQNMGSHTSVMGKGPETFRFKDNKAIIGTQDDDVQRIVNYFKGWLPQVNQVYGRNLRREREEAEMAERSQVKKEIEEKERRLRVLQTVKI
jgi:serine/threonine protein kinase